MLRFPRPLAASAAVATVALTMAGTTGPAVAQEDEPVTHYCTDPVYVALSGPEKEKTLTLPGDRFIYTSPGLFVTLTNARTGQSTTQNITGTILETTDPAGNVVGVSRGRSLLLDPVATPHFAFVTGRWTWTLDPADWSVVSPRSGTGTITDACALIGSSQL